MTDTLTPAAVVAPPAAEPRRRVLRWAGPVAALLVLAVLPYSAVDVPVLLPGPLSSPGTLQLLALCLLFGGLALGYDLLFGRTGLLSFGHALYVAAGAYGAQLAMSRLGLPLLPAVLLTVAAVTVLALLLGAVSLRPTALGGVGFAMVTLAFAQAGSILVARDPGGVTGGGEGLPLDAAHVPAALIGVTNTANLYWLALAYLAVTAGLLWWATSSPVGRHWQAVRDNERRAAVLGIHPYRAKLAACVLAGGLAGLGGVLHLLITGGASPQTAGSEFTLTLLVMAVLGGSGTRWGPVLGGVLFTLADQRLGVLSASSAVDGLPAVLRAPLSQPLVLLGALFVVAVYVLPGGLSRITRRGRPG